MTTSLLLFDFPAFSLGRDFCWCFNSLQFASVAFWAWKRFFMRCLEHQSAPSCSSSYWMGFNAPLVLVPGADVPWCSWGGPGRSLNHPQDVTVPSVSIANWLMSQWCNVNVVRNAPCSLTCCRDRSSLPLSGHMQAMWLILRLRMAEIEAEAGYRVNNQLTKLYGAPSLCRQCSGSWWQQWIQQTKTLVLVKCDIKGKEMTCRF